VNIIGWGWGVNEQKKAERAVAREEKKKALEFYKNATLELSKGIGPGGLKRWRIKEWEPKYTKILVMYAKGMSAAQIAAQAEIGYAANFIGRIVRDPLFRLKLSAFNRRMDVAIIEKATEEMSALPEIYLARDKLLESSEKAADTLLKLLNPRSSLSRRTSDKEKALLFNVARDILDRAGLKTVTVEEKDGGHRKEYSPEEIQSALSNARELEAIAGRLSKGTSSFVLDGSKRMGEDESAAPEPAFVVETPEESEEMAERVAE
jgi:hypothetical protein